MSDGELRTQCISHRASVRLTGYVTRTQAMSDDSDTDDSTTGRRGVLTSVVAARRRRSPRSGRPPAGTTPSDSRSPLTASDRTARCCYATHSREELEDSPASDRPSGEGTISYEAYVG